MMHPICRTAISRLRLDFQSWHLITKRVSHQSRLPASKKWLQVQVGTISHKDAFWKDKDDGFLPRPDLQKNLPVAFQEVTGCNLMSTSQPLTKHDINLLQRGSLCFVTTHHLHFPVTPKPDSCSLSPFGGFTEITVGYFTHLAQLWLFHWTRTTNWLCSCWRTHLHFYEPLPKRFLDHRSPYYPAEIQWAQQSLLTAAGQRSQDTFQHSFPHSPNPKACFAEPVLTLIFRQPRLWAESVLQTSRTWFSTM